MSVRVPTVCGTVAHVLAWYALGRVQEAHEAWAGVCDLRRRVADAEPIGHAARSPR